jgi:hypothetical protein
MISCTFHWLLASARHSRTANTSSSSATQTPSVPSTSEMDVWKSIGSPCSRRVKVVYTAVY